MLVKRFLTNAVVHEADSAQSPVSTMTHHVLHVERDQRLPVLVDLASAPGRTVVFTRTKHGAKALARQLNAKGIPTVDLHGNLSQGARTRNMDAFHSGKATTLVATDIAARGIHVDDVALVVHADPPVEHKAYTHRSGRTARAGSDGTVVTLATADQLREVRSLTKAAGINPTTTRLQGMSDPVLTTVAPGARALPGGLETPAPSAGSGSDGLPSAQRGRRTSSRLGLGCRLRPGSGPDRRPSGRAQRRRPRSRPGPGHQDGSRPGPSGRSSLRRRRWGRQRPRVLHEHLGRRGHRQPLGRRLQHRSPLTPAAPARSTAAHLRASRTGSVLGGWAGGARLWRLRDRAGSGQVPGHLRVAVPAPADPYGRRRGRARRRASPRPRRAGRPGPGGRAVTCGLQRPGAKWLSGSTPHRRATCACRSSSAALATT